MSLQDFKSATAKKAGAAMLALMIPFTSATAAGNGQQHELSQSAKNGLLAVQASQYAKLHPEIITVYAARGAMDEQLLSDKKVEEVINRRIGEQFTQKGLCPPPIKFWFAHGANSHGTAISYYAGGLPVAIDKNGDGRETFGESAFALSESISPAVKEKVVSTYSSKAKTLRLTDLRCETTSTVALLDHQ